MILLMPFVYIFRISFYVLDPIIFKLFFDFGAYLSGAWSLHQIYIVVSEHSTNGRICQGRNKSSIYGRRLFLKAVPPIYKGV